ncbi:hypothetical protein COX05_02300 [candidate division WWE3 bacterium CG22_combo_CG10-13_8_21_14_all_39_12]|uniref:Polymerase nucleotidyl transferase domain-containing protein n=1 Tax=candidate division WWE3 bacterium CG22_combo_CG10-13_8_21_14_all_39_12 TaxID=1975094 RepID=A0A2H0BHT5_UNCKA|nr:MAG: hypothetical protein COX05_02300 [candidate division WWE3 bacterium CG22_combo_CG10-13_8_21_14_all_39_12]
MTQNEVFKNFYEDYKDIFPQMVHISGGLPDSKGEGSSDVDVWIKTQHYFDLADKFPKGTHVQISAGKYGLYSLNNYARTIEVYASDEDHNHALDHRRTELELNKQYPQLAMIAFTLKKEYVISTEEAWAKVLDLGDDYNDALMDTSRVLKIASLMNMSVNNLSILLPT